MGICAWRDTRATQQVAEADIVIVEGHEGPQP